VLDRDEAVEKLRTVLPDLDERDLLRQLGEDGRRFVWIRRGLTPQLAQQIHDLGLPGLMFRRELRRVHPAGRIAPHILGQADVDNRGVSGIEKFIDATDQAVPVIAAIPSTREPVRLTLDLAVQHAVRQELQAALTRYRAKGASAIVMDARTGAIAAAVSLPDFDPDRPAAASDAERLDRVMGGVFELGSIFKAFTVAMALDAGAATFTSQFDARQPLQIAGRKIDDFHGQKRLLTTSEIFIHSSNIGAGLMALKVGGQRQRHYLDKFGLTGDLVMEGAGVARPLLPHRWTDLETATVAYGHGLALSPLQFAAAAAALVNGGVRVWPSILASSRPQPSPVRAISSDASRQMRDLMRLNVTDAKGTGRRADVPGLEIGGKTGSADVVRNGRYAEHAVIASFLAAFPMSQPRYVTLLTLFEPEPTVETKAQITAGVNAAPASGRMIARIAPLLGVRAAAMR
jgi:cell division protein FtsI (penicillin-binding protein 3)